MCGICGKIDLGGGRVDRDLILSMCRTLPYRGPDDEGVFVDGGVGLGHHRLSIIDLSAAGRQPMANEDGTLHPGFNGEIYNFPEIRERLRSR